MAGFHTADVPLGVLGAFELARLLHPTLVVGGTKALALGLFQAGARAGVQFRAVADVTVIRPAETEVVIGCRDGQEYAARAVVSTLDPKTTFLELIEEAVVPDGIRQAAEAWQLEPTGPFTAHFGIKGSRRGWPPRTQPVRWCRCSASTMRPASPKPRRRSAAGRSSTPRPGI